VLWQGLHWDPQALIGRLLWLAVAVGLTALAAVFFRRFDPAYERRRKPSGERAITPAAEVTHRSPTAAPVHLTPVPAKARRSRFGYLVISELRLMLKGRRWWWYAVMASLIVASAAVPDANGRHTGPIGHSRRYPTSSGRQAGNNPLGPGRDGLHRPPPGQIRTCASTHTALMKDGWRKSVLQDKGAVRGVMVSTFRRPE